MPKSSDDSYLDSSRTAIVDVVEDQRREIRRLAADEISKLEIRRDRDLRTLDDVIGALGGQKSKAVEPPTSSAPRSSSSRPRRRKKRGSPVQIALENREAVLRHLVEADRQMAAGEIRKELRLSEYATANALKKLASTGQVNRLGTGSGTRYEASRKTHQESPAVTHREGTLDGKILLILEDRGSASDSELSQALRVPIEKVRKLCGELIDEGEIRLVNRGGARVYVRLRAA